MTLDEVIAFQEKYDRLEKEVLALRKERLNASDLRKHIRNLRDDLTTARKYAEIGKIAAASGTPDQFESIGCHDLAKALRRLI